MQPSSVTPQVPGIPTPTEDPASLRSAIMAMKQAIEIMAGNSGTEPQPNIYVTNQQPTARKVGDLWIVEYPSISLNYWNGSQWVKLAIAP